MAINIIALLIVLGVAALVIVWGYRAKDKRVTDEVLAQWLGFLVKDNEDEPEKMPKTTMAKLEFEVYESVNKFINPKLDAEYKERLLKLNNEMAARAIQVEMVSRRMAEGKALSAYDDKILIREGLRTDSTNGRNGNGRKKRDSDPAFVDAQDHRTFDDVRDGVLPRTE
jgi:hypothetical protein